MNDIIKIVQGLEDSDILLKESLKQLKMKQKIKKGGFLNMLLGSLGAGRIGNILAGKRIVRASSGTKKGKGIVRPGYGKEWDF